MCRVNTTNCNIVTDIDARPQREAIAALLSVAFIIIAAYTVFSPRIARRA